MASIQEIGVQNHELKGYNLFPLVSGIFLKCISDDFWMTMPILNESLLMEVIMAANNDICMHHKILELN